MILWVLRRGPAPGRGKLCFYWLRSSEPRPDLGSAPALFRCRGPAPDMQESGRALPQMPPASPAKSRPLLCFSPSSVLSQSPSLNLQPQSWKMLALFNPTSKHQCLLPGIIRGDSNPGKALSTAGDQYARVTLACSVGGRLFLEAPGRWEGGRDRERESVCFCV